MAIFEDVEVENSVQILWDYLSVYDQPITADAIFLFGSGQIRVPKRGAELFHDGYAKTVLVSGTKGYSSMRIYGKSETELFTEVLLREDVPKASIIVESKATNTGENVTLGMEMLRASGHDPRRVILVSIPYHSRRCIVTFRKQESEIECVSCPPLGHFSDFIPFTSERFALRLAGEIDRILSYGEKGIIIPQDVPREVIEAAETIRRHIPPSAGVLMK